MPRMPARITLLRFNKTPGHGRAELVVLILVEKHEGSMNSETRNNKKLCSEIATKQGRTVPLDGGRRINTISCVYRSMICFSPAA